MSREIVLLTDLLDQRGYSHRTKESYLHWVNRLLKHYPTKSLKKLSQAEVRDYFLHLKSQQYKAESIRQAASAVKFYYKNVAPRSDIELAIPRIQRKRPLAKIPSQPDVLKTIEHIGDKQIQLLCQLIYGLGLELQEARGLKVRNIVTSTGEIEFNPQRTRQKRTVSIPYACKNELIELIAKKTPTSYVFSMRNDMPISESTIQRSWSNARIKAQVGAHLNLRSLRHCYIRHLESLGVRIIDILHNMGINKSFAMAYYAGYHGANGSIPFSPLDKKIPANANQANESHYVSIQRIDQIKTIESKQFDFKKLTQLLEELNIAHSNSAIITTAMLVRSVIDHIPPVFGCESFHEVSNNYAGTKSFKKSMGILSGALRNIADSFLHERIRQHEDLPEPQQVDFRPQLDQLLGEIVRVNIFKKNGAQSPN